MTIITELGNFFILNILKKLKHLITHKKMGVFLWCGILILYIQISISINININININTNLDYVNDLLIMNRVVFT